MALSTRAKVLQSLFNDLKGINGNSPYSLCVGTVERVRRNETSVPNNDYPYIGIHVEKELLEHEQFPRCLSGTIRIILWLMDYGSDEQEGFEAVEELYDNVVVAIYTNQGRKLSGETTPNAVMSTIISAESQEHEDPNVGFLELELELKYNRPTNEVTV